MPITFRYPPWLRHEKEQQNKWKRATATVKESCEAKFGGINCKVIYFTIRSRKSAKSNNKQMMMKCNGKAAAEGSVDGPVPVLDLHVHVVDDLHVTT